MGTWLKGRRNALVDAALAYVAFEWIGPALVSALISLASTANGRCVLFLVGYPLFLVGAYVLIDKLDPLEPVDPHPNLAPRPSQSTVPSWTYSRYLGHRFGSVGGWY